jgi:hypothetical protein
MRLPPARSAAAQDARKEMAVKAKEANKPKPKPDDKQTSTCGL